MPDMVKVESLLNELISEFSDGDDTEMDPKPEDEMTEEEKAAAKAAAEKAAAEAKKAEESEGLDDSSGEDAGTEGNAPASEMALDELQKSIKAMDQRLSKVVGKADQVNQTNQIVANLANLVAKMAKRMETTEASVALMVDGMGLSENVEKAWTEHVEKNKAPEQVDTAQAILKLAESIGKSHANQSVNKSANEPFSKIEQKGGQQADPRLTTKSAAFGAGLVALAKQGA